MFQNAGGITANDVNVRSVNYAVMALFISIRLEIISVNAIEYTDFCHPNL